MSIEKNFWLEFHFSSKTASTIAKKKQKKKIHAGIAEVKNKAKRSMIISTEGKLGQNWNPMALKAGFHVRLTESSLIFLKIDWKFGGMEKERRRTPSLSKTKGWSLTLFNFKNG